MMQERIRLLRDHIRFLNDAGVRQTLFYRLAAQSLRETAGEPLPTRRAKAFAHLLDEVEQVVLPHELRAGSILGLWPLVDNPLSPDEQEREAVDVLQRYLRRKRSGEIPSQRVKRGRWAMIARDHYDNSVPFRDLQRLIGEMQARFAGSDDLQDYEVARELERHFSFDYGQEGRIVRELPWAVANHLDLNYARVVDRGLGDIHREVTDRLARATGETRTFYESCRIALDAAIRFIRRYAGALRAAGRAPEIGEGRATELEEMAGVVEYIARAAPRSFREAIQLVWMVHIVGNLAGGSAMSFARFDQYMFPFYRDDLAAGRTTREEAKTLLSCLWLKVNEPKMRTVQSMCLGGTTPEGTDAANELTDLCLEVCGELRQPYPNTSVRLAPESPEWLYDRAAETVGLGLGQPMLLNDSMWVPNLGRRGYAEEDARQYYNMGCTEIMVQGMMSNWAWCGGVHLPGLLELVFRNGEENLAGETGIPTGTLDSLETFQQFFEAFCEQLRHRIGLVRENARSQYEARRGRWYDPFASALIDDCLERGRDLFQGGCRYPPLRAISAYGLATAADSLMAVKKFVFDEDRITLQDLWEALKADFSGHERLQAALVEESRAYGNDIDEVDELACRIFNFYADTVHAQNDGEIPGTFATSLFSYTHHVHAGEQIAATPDGRNSREPESDTVAPSQGRDVCGPTAVLNSVAKLDHSRITAAYALNMKLNPTLVAGQRGSDALKSLIRGYFDMGGGQIQFNFVDTDVLRDAQKHPDKHRNLIVRVAGFCEFFTSIDRELQNEIISRTAHGA